MDVNEFPDIPFPLVIVVVCIGFQTTAGKNIAVKKTFQR